MAFVITLPELSGEGVYISSFGWGLEWWRLSHEEAGNAASLSPNSSVFVN